MPTLSLILAFLVSASPVHAAGPATRPVTREFELVAAPAKLPLIDGRMLDVWAYNGQVPGPTLRIKVGERLRVRFRNALPQPTTIHWHGLRLPNGMDGVPGVTQPPIAPGETFIYEFTASDAGTFWFHPHLRGSEQLERGLFGVLIVEDERPPAFSREVIWVLDDWLLGADGQIFPEFNTRHDLAHDGRWGDAITVNGRKSPTLVVRAGERLRIRLLNVANGRVFTPDFGALQAKVIAFDGLYADEPLPPDGLEIAPGNRVDLDVIIPASLRGKKVSVVDRSYARQVNALIDVAVVDEEPLPLPEVSVAGRGDARRYLEEEPRSPAIDYRLNARAGGPMGIEWTLNEQAFRHEEGKRHAHPAPTVRLPLGKWSRLRFINESFRLHPMHTHGQFFRVLSRDGKAVDERHWRDTVLVHAKETVEVAVLARDPGKWMLHCHIQEHAESGMMSLFEVR